MKKTTNEYYELIINTCCNYFGLDYRDVFLNRKSRNTKWIRPRQISMFYLRKYTFLSDSKISAFFLKHRTTYVSTQATLDKWISTDKKFKATIDEIGIIIENKIKKFDAEKEYALNNDEYNINDLIICL